MFLTGRFNRFSAWACMLCSVDFLIIFSAQVLPYLVVAAGVVIWLLLGRRTKVAMVVQGGVTVIVVLGLIVLAGALHTDPRPFVADPSVRPLFPHPADNGFPSDHTAFTVGVGVLVAYHRRVIGLVLAIVGVCAGAARVAAHVHHAQDIACGAVIAVLAVIVAVLVWRAVAGAVLRRAERARLLRPSESATRQR